MQRFVRVRKTRRKIDHKFNLRPEVKSDFYCGYFHKTEARGVTSGVGLLYRITVTLVKNCL
jgi:hypothetical protein